MDENIFDRKIMYSNYDKPNSLTEQREKERIELRNYLELF